MGGALALLLIALCANGTRLRRADAARTQAAQVPGAQAQGAQGAADDANNNV